MTDMAKNQWVSNQLRITEYLLEKMIKDIQYVYDAAYSNKNVLTEGECICVCSKAYCILEEGTALLKLIAEQVCIKIIGEEGENDENDE